MSSNLNLPFSLRSNVICQQVENETLLLNPDSGDIFGLDGVSTRVWELMQVHSNMQDVKAQMMEEFEVEETQLEKDLLTFFQQLSSLDLINSESP